MAERDQPWKALFPNVRSHVCSNDFMERLGLVDQGHQGLEAPSPYATSNQYFNDSGGQDDLITNPVFKHEYTLAQSRYMGDWSGTASQFKINQKRY
jgi:hypothetical protein